MILKRATVVGRKGMYEVSDMKKRKDRAWQSTNGRAL
jgi:hypothetical protein